MKIPILIRKKNQIWIVVCPTGTNQPCPTWEVALAVAIACHQFHGIRIEPK